MCSFKEGGRYCVRSITLAIPEFAQLESVKSMMRYLPAKGTAGLARLWVRTPSREPSPPARMTARVFMPPASSLRCRVIGLRQFVQFRVGARRAPPREIRLHAAQLE